MNEYESFCQEVLDYVCRTLPDGEVRLLRDGYCPDEAQKDEWDLVRNINVYYHHDPDGALVGDYINVHFPAGVNAMDLSFRMEMRRLYDDYLACGWSFVEKTVEENYRIVTRNTGMDLQTVFSTFENCSPGLFIRPLPFIRERARLEDKLYRPVGDIALVVYYLTDNSHGYLQSVKVPLPFADTWGVSHDEIFRCAMRNTMRMFPPRLCVSLEEVMGKKPGRVFMRGKQAPVEHLPHSELPVYVTAVPDTNGAVSLFYPGVAARLGAMFGCSYYIVFPGRDSAALFAADVLSLEGARRCKQAVIKPTEDAYLSDSLYYFDIDKRRISRLKGPEDNWQFSGKG